MSKHKVRERIINKGDVGEVFYILREGTVKCHDIGTGIVTNSPWRRCLRLPHLLMQHTTQDLIQTTLKLFTFEIR